jgi:cation:H+ antiporter
LPASPSRLGAGDPSLRLGNIAATIIHFAAFNAGVIALVNPLALDHDTTRLCLPAAAASPAILAAMLLARRRLGRIEGAGLIALHGSYVAVAIIYQTGASIARGARIGSRRRC